MLYEKWCHIVDEAVFAPNGGQFENVNIFRVSQPISLRTVFIDRGNVENFHRNQVWYCFQSLSWLKI